MNQPDPTLTLSLPLSAVNRLLEGAAQLPYGVIAAVIHDVQRQADAQLQQKSVDEGAR